MTDTEFLCERKLAALAPDLHRRFSDSVLGLQRILTSYRSIFPYYTDHSALHSLQIIRFCNILIGERNIGKLNRTEIYVLLMACYLHDVGMGVFEKDYDNFCAFLHLDGNADKVGTVRSNHQEFSSLFIGKYAPFFDIPNDELIFAIRQVARGHRRSDLYHRTDYPSALYVPDYDPVCLPYLAALIRLADELDIAEDRNIAFWECASDAAKDRVSARELEKHRAVKHLVIKEDAFVMQVQTGDEALYADLVGLKDKLNDTLLLCRQVVTDRTPFIITQNRVCIERIRMTEQE